ncbi:MAG: GNAT family N-acetyltransferase [Actinobacteria bacterium]|nr:GNAT family N-acetyltransferase [Actinomycetota bacterium]
MAMLLRPYRTSDRGAVYDICLRTGASGGDASSLVSDPTLFGDLWAGAYVDLEPEHATVLADGDDRAVGYVLAAADTLAFERRCETDWWPDAQARHPVGSGRTPLDQLLVALVHDPPSVDPDVVARYPSHLHIDLLPVAQRQGWGRRMVVRALELVGAAGSTGLHLGVDEANTAAHAFYERIGMELLGSDGSIRTYAATIPPGLPGSGVEAGD